MGKLIVIEGLDGSGKATQAALLTGRLKKRGGAVRMVSFPDYRSRSSALVQMYLAGEFGDDPMAVNPYAASAFYAVDRYASWKKDWGSFYAQGGLVVADRYTTSNAIHQCSKLPEDAWEGYVQWLEDFEYAKMGIPRPDLVVYLEVDLPLSQKLMRKRYGDDAKKDIHERNIEYLMRSRRAAQWCAGRLGWVPYACSENGEMLDPEHIADVLMDVVQAHFGKEDV